MSGAKFDSCRFLFSAFYLGLRISNKNKTRQCNNKQWKRTCIYLFSKQFFFDESNIKSNSDNIKIKFTLN